MTVLLYTFVTDLGATVLVKAVSAHRAIEAVEQSDLAACLFTLVDEQEFEEEPCDS